jgi:hypothetical protein
MLTGFFLGVETSHSKHTHHRPGSLEPLWFEAAAAGTFRSVSVAVFPLSFDAHVNPKQRPFLAGDVNASGFGRILKTDCRKELSPPSGGFFILQT